MPCGHLMISLAIAGSCTLTMNMKDDPPRCVERHGVARLRAERLERRLAQVC